MAGGASGLWGSAAGRVKPVSRITLARRMGLGLLGILGLLLLWGVAVEPRLVDRQEQTGHVPGLPSGWEGRRVGLISDLQVGMWLANTDTVERAVGLLVNERPDVVLLAGDFLYGASPSNSQGQIETMVGLVRPLARAGIPTYAVLGSHDYSMGSTDPINEKSAQTASRLRDAFEALGIRVLDNVAIPLAPPAGGAGDPLYLVGIGSRGAEEDQPAAAVGQVPAGSARLVFMHNPESFAEIPSGAAPLALAGHTHGGQVRLPFLTEWSWLSLVRAGEVYRDPSGWVDRYGQPGNRLYVNIGIGFSLVPIRINARPEVTLVTLRGAAR